MSNTASLPGSRVPLPTSPLLPGGERALRAGPSPQVTSSAVTAPRSFTFRGPRVERRWMVLAPRGCGQCTWPLFTSPYDPLTS